MVPAVCFPRKNCPLGVFGRNFVCGYSLALKFRKQIRKVAISSPHNSFTQHRFSPFIHCNSKRTELRLSTIRQNVIKKLHQNTHSTADICRNSVSRSKTSEDVHGYTVYIYSMYSVTEGEDVLAGQRGTVCHQLCDCETAVCL